MFRYFARLYEKYGLAVYPIALFSYDKPYRAEKSSYKVEFPNKLVLEFHYDVIQLNKLNWKDYVTSNNPIASALMAKMKIELKDRPLVKLECLRLLATLKLDPARSQLISGFIDTYLRLNFSEQKVLQQQLQSISPKEQEAVMQIVTSWMQEGIKQGLEQGLKQGLEQGKKRELALVLRQLNKRLGNITEELKTTLEQLSIEKLEELGEALLDFSTESDLTTWLNQHRKS